MALFLPFMEHRPALLSDVAVGGLVVPGSGLQSLLEVALKIAICVPALALLSGTTPMPELLAGFERLRAPRLFVSLVGFTWRYVFVLIDEFARLRRAREARGFGGSRWFNLVTTGRIIGTTFIRSFERAERVYQAMLARGFTGSLPAGAAPRLRPADVAFALGVAGASVSLALFAR
jgi:cobalt/nickel transport system permease protein